MGPIRGSAHPSPFVPSFETIGIGSRIPVSLFPSFCPSLHPSLDNNLKPLLSDEMEVSTEAVTVFSV